MSEIIAAVLAGVFAYVLGKRQAEHQIRFTHIYEQRAQVIAQLYRLSFQVQEAVGAWTSPFWSGGENEGQVREKRAIERYNELSIYYHENSLWLDSPSCQQLEKFLEETKGILLDFKDVTEFSVQEWQGLDKPEGKYKSWKMLNDKARTELPQIREQLRKEFRGILDIAELPKRPAHLWWRRRFSR